MQARQRAKPKAGIPQLHEFVEQRDYRGALALLTFKQRTGEHDVDGGLHMWIGYVAFHAGDYARAVAAYEEELRSRPSNERARLALSVALFFCHKMQEAERLAAQLPESPLQNRLLFHIAHRLDQESRVLAHHRMLSDTVEDQLTLAAMHYARGHYQNVRGARASCARPRCPR